MDDFGPDLYRWERNYFLDHFVRDVCRIELESSFTKELEAELSGLAERLAGTKRSLVHRDFQSQNVMIRDGEPFSSTSRVCVLEAPFTIWVPSSAIPI